MKTLETTHMKNTDDTIDHKPSAIAYELFIVRRRAEQLV